MDVQPLIIAFLLVALVAVWAWGAGRVRRGNLRRQRRAQRGERGAEALLEGLGFRIVDRQVTGTWSLWVDGEPHEVSCRADLLVESRSGRFVAEVKTGTRAPDPTHPATRRQLLEYAVAFDVDGVLLVDMEQASVHRVDYPL